MFWSVWRCIVADFLYKFSGTPIKELVDADVERNLKWDKWAKTHTGKLRRLNYCLLKKKRISQCVSAADASPQGPLSDE